LCQNLFLRLRQNRVVCSFRVTYKYSSLFCPMISTATNYKRSILFCPITNNRSKRICILCQHLFLRLWQNRVVCSFRVTYKYSSLFCPMISKATNYKRSILFCPIIRNRSKSKFVFCAEPCFLLLTLRENSLECSYLVSFFPASLVFATKATNYKHSSLFCPITNNRSKSICILCQHLFLRLRQNRLECSFPATNYICK
jgi:hypothetical protein